MSYTSMELAKMLSLEGELLDNANKERKMHEKKWSFEAYLAPSGEINMFVLGIDGLRLQLEALVYRWQADEQQPFFRAVERLVADEDAWRNWAYVDAVMFDKNPEWREMVAGSADVTGKEALLAYYEACRNGGEKCFHSYSDGGAVRWWNKEHNAAVHPASAQRQGALQ